MLYIIGLGLNEKGLSFEGIEAVEKCEKVYLENYTVEFPYPAEELEKITGSEIIIANRELVESDKLIREAEKKDIALLVYGSPLTATTHITLIQEAKKQRVKCKVIYNASVLDAVAECGLQLYKFGKIASLPKFEAESFMEIIKENQKANAHSLILADIGLNFEDAIERIKEIAEDRKIVVCSRLGTKDSKIYYDNFSKLKELNVKAPFCFVIPGKLHFMEEEILTNFSREGF